MLIDGSRGSREAGSRNKILEEGKDRMEGRVHKGWWDPAYRKYNIIIFKNDQNMVLFTIKFDDYF
jgi:hypothetical protein